MNNEQEQIMVPKQRFGNVGIGSSEMTTPPSSRIPSPASSMTSSLTLSCASSARTSPDYLCEMFETLSVVFKSLSSRYSDKSTPNTSPSSPPLPLFVSTQDPTSDPTSDSWVDTVEERTREERAIFPFPMAGGHTHPSCGVRACPSSLSPFQLEIFETKNYFDSQVNRSERNFVEAKGEESEVPYVISPFQDLEGSDSESSAMDIDEETCWVETIESKRQRVVKI